MLLLNASDTLSAITGEYYKKTSGSSCKNLLQQLAGSDFSHKGGKILQKVLFASLNLYWLQTTEGAESANTPWGPGLKLPAEVIKLPFNSDSLSRYIVAST